jgi:hypothetical protein
MYSSALRAAACCALAVPTAARAHAIAGARVFPVTLTLDDPGVADEATLPQITWQRSGADGGPGPVHETDLDFEYDKRITTDFGLAINDGLDIQDTAHDKIRMGGENIEVTGKYQVLIDAPHELIFTVGIVREFGRTGTLHTGDDQYGSTSPTAYVGKGLGDLPIEALRPFAVTGEFSYTIADRELKQVYAPAPAPGIGMAQAQFNLGGNNAYAGGLSLQYSIPYLVSQVRDVQAPSFFKHLVPLVELTWSSPASAPSTQGTQFVIAPGVIWINRAYQVGLEALIPGNRASGTNVGVVAQFHLFLDDLLPNSLGKPIADW